MMGLLMLSGCDNGSRADLVFLTRDGCVQTEVMRQRLDAALAQVGGAHTYAVVDQGGLAADDVRTGYPTPTVLNGGCDLFGLAPPTPPFPQPT